MSALFQQPAEVLSAGLRRATRLRGELTWVIAGQALAFCGSFLLVKLLTNIMGPVEYGKLAFGITLAGVLQMFLYGPLGQAVFRFLSIAREKDELPSYLRVLSFLHRRLALTVICVAVVSTGSVALLHSVEWALVVFFACLYGLSTGILSSFAFLQNAMRQRKVVAFHQGADPWLRAVLSIILIFVFRNSGYLVLLGYFLSAAILDISQGLSARRNRELATALLSPRDPQCELAYRHELFRYATPYLLAAAINSISMYGDRWTLQYLYGTGQLGIYAALCQIANAPVALGSGMIMQLMMPVIFQRAGSLESHAQRRHSRRLLFVSIAVFAIVMLAVGAAFALFGSTVIAWVSSPAFAEHHQVLWIIFVGMVMLQLGQQATIMGQIHRSIRQYLPCYFLNAVSTITVSFLLGRAYGMRGVAIGLLTSNSLYFFSVLVVNRRFTSDVIAKDERA